LIFKKNFEDFLVIILLRLITKEKKLNCTVVGKPYLTVLALFMLISLMDLHDLPSLSEIFLLNNRYAF